MVTGGWVVAGIESPEMRKKHQNRAVEKKGDILKFVINTVPCNTEFDTTWSPHGPGMLTSG